MPEDWRQTDANLRLLLEAVYDINETFVFEEILERFGNSIEFKFDCLFYLTEKQWFKETNRPAGKLRFPYLSFELKNKKITRFRSRTDLVRRESELLTESYIKEESRLCTILYKSDYDPQEISRITNLIKRIFVAFYKNCGAYDHFRESVSRRFIREFYDEESRTLSSLADYISANCGMEVSLWNQKDEMYFRQQTAPENLLIPIVASNKDYSNRLFRDEGFEIDLKASVTKKNQTYGRTYDGQVYYVIRTLSDNYFIGESGDANFKTLQRAVAIYSKQDEPLSLDAVYHANRLIETHLRTTQEIQYHSIIAEGSYTCAILEEELSANPISTKSDLADYITRSLNPVLQKVATHTRATSVCLRLYEPALEQLIPIAFGSENTPPTLRIGEEDFVSERAFSLDDSIDILHPNKLRQDLIEARNNNPNAASSIEAALQERARSKDGLGRIESSAIAMPVRKGNFLIGVIEFSSEDASRLTYDKRFFELVASLCGDAIRRLELANDRGWLARMSFVHAARHRIEAILRDLKAADADVAKELVDLMQKGATVRSTNEVHHFSNLTSELIALLSNSTEETRSNILRDLQVVADVRGIPERSGLLIKDIFETLIANSSHSEFRPQYLQITLRENGTSADQLKIEYCPPDVPINMERMEQLCVAPIADDQTHTFHYGLFLLSSQIRMAGGVASGKPVEPNELGATDFGLTFLIPLAKE